MELLSNGMQSRWGRMLERKKELLRTSREPEKQQTIKGSTENKKKKIIVAVGQAGVGTTCPECMRHHKDLELDSLQDFKLHVFQCRVQSGTNPLLPVVSLVPQPPRKQPDNPRYTVATESSFDAAIRRPSLRIKRYGGTIIPSAGARQFTNPEVSTVFSSGYKQHLRGNKMISSSTTSSTTDKSEPRDFDRDRSELCTKANRLALRRLIAVKKYRNDTVAEQTLQKLLFASHQEAELDLSQVDIKYEDVAVLASIVADHPTAALLAINEKVAKSVSSVLAPALISVASTNKNLMHITHTERLGDRWSSRLGSLMEQSIQDRHLQHQELVVGKLSQKYAEWEQFRKDDIDSMKKSESDNRKEIIHERTKCIKYIKTVHKKEFHILEIKQRKRQIAAIKNKQRALMSSRETSVRDQLIFIELSDLFILFIQRESLQREYLFQNQYSNRRQLKTVEEKAHKHSKGRERSRLNRESTARQILDDTEFDYRTEIVGMHESAEAVLRSKFEEGIEYFDYLERQQVIRYDLQKLYLSIKQSIEKDEIDSRQWIIDRRVHYTQMKEQERSKARELIAAGERTDRSCISDDFLKASEHLSQEVATSLDWLAEVVSLKNIEEEFAGVMKQLPNICIDTQLQYNTKPFMYFVHPYTEVEPPTWINTVAKFICVLEDTWVSTHKAVTKRLQTQVRSERDAYTVLNRVKARNSKFFAKIFATDEPEDDKKRRNKKLKASVQVAVKMGAMSNMTEKADATPALSPENISECKQVMWGGYIEVSLLPSDSDPEWLAEAIQLSCQTYLNVEIDGTVYKGSNDLSDMLETHPISQFELPAYPTPNELSGAAELDPVVVPTIPKTDSVPCGRVLKILLPNPESTSRSAEEILNTDVITRIIRSCRLCTTGHGLPAPVLIQIQFKAVLLFDSSVVIKNSTVRPNELSESTGTAVMGVVLALPFISQCSRGGITVEYIEGMKPEELQLVPEPFNLTDPPTVTRRKDQSQFSVMSGGHQGGGLSLTNFHDAYVSVEITEGFTTDDIICMKNNAKVQLEGTNLLFKEKDNTYQVGTTILGTLPSCSEVQENVAASRLFVIHLRYDENPGMLAAEQLRHFLKALRFANTSVAPVEGTRTIVVSIADSNRYVSRMSIIVDVIGEDNPTEMIIPHLKFSIRSSTVPTHLRHYISPCVIPIAESAVVQDVDTDRFIGGSLTITLNGSSKGEGIALCLLPELTQTQLLNSVRSKTLRSEERKSPSPDMVRSDNSSSMLESASLNIYQASSVNLDMSLGNNVQHWVDSEHQFCIERPPTGNPIIKYQGRAIASVDKGEILLPGKSIDSIDKDTSNNEVVILFSTTGMMSIEACQELLRSIVTYNITTTPMKGTFRQLDIVLRIGVTVNGEPEKSEIPMELPDYTPEDDFILTEKVQLRHAPSLLAIPEKYVSAEYREGSGPQRLAPFDLIQDKQGFVENYNAGYIVVEIIEGANDEDSLALREDESIKLVQHTQSTKKAPTAIRRSFTSAANAVFNMNKMSGSLAVFEAPLSPLSPTSASGDSFEAASAKVLTPRTPSIVPKSLRISELKDKVRDHVKEEIQNRRGRRESLLGMAQQEVRSIIRDLTKLKDKDANLLCSADLFFSGTERPIAVYKKLGQDLLHVIFKGDQNTLVSRKHVIAILRNLTYCNLSSDPQVLKKVIRVTISDAPPCSSQCVFEMNIQAVDDVTEIRVRNTKIRYTPSGVVRSPFCLCPRDSSELCDADTEYFDGGHLTFQAITGGAKGDTLGFLSPQQQLSIYPKYSEGRLRLTDDNKKLMLVEEGTDDRQVCSVTLDNEKTILKLQFVKSSESKLMSLTRASYVMNCVTFHNNSELKKATTRTFQIRVSDGENPVEGKAKLQVDTQVPHCYFTPWGFCSDVVCKGDDLNISFNDQKSKITIPTEKNDKVITSGFASIQIHSNESPCALVVPSSFVYKEGNLYQGATFLSKLDITPTSAKMDFTWASKITAKTLQQVLRGFSIQFDEKPKEVVKIETTVGTESSTVCLTTLRYS